MKLANISYSLLLITGLLAGGSVVAMGRAQYKDELIHFMVANRGSANPVALNWEGKTASVSRGQSTGLYILRYPGSAHITTSAGKFDLSFDKNSGKVILMDENGNEAYQGALSWYKPNVLATVNSDGSISITFENLDTLQRSNI